MHSRFFFCGWNHDSVSAYKRCPAIGGAHLPEMFVSGVSMALFTDYYMINVGYKCHEARAVYI